jgi:hypothetical protein
VAKLDTAGEWMINDNHLYIPSAGIKVEHTNLAGSSSGRTEDGVMHSDWVRRDIRKVCLQWKVLTGTELDYKGRKTAVAPAINITLFGVCAGKGRWYGALEVGGMLSFNSAEEVYMLGSRIMTASVGVRL